MAKPDVVYECHEADTSYRLVPNPDAPPGEGYRHGAALQWKDPGQDWRGTWMIAPEAMEALGLALLEASKDHKT